jgi:ABC-type branched-subunit amino acid transport system ATPase component
VPAVQFGIRILIAEQSVHVALGVARRVLILERCRLVFERDADALALEPGTKQACFD